MTTSADTRPPTGPSRRTFLATALAGATALTGCLSGRAPGSTPVDVDVTEGFEDGLDGWTLHADVPADPNRPGSDVEWHVDPVADLPGDASDGLRYHLDGRQDDGTVWALRSLPVEAGRTYHVRVAARAYSESESFNTRAHLVAYAGATPPEDEASFPRPNTNSTGNEWATGGLREPLDRAAGWEEYAFEWTTPAFEGDRLYVAVGISAVWETELTYFLDSVGIRVTEGEGGGD